MDDQCPVCKSDRYLNPKLRLLVSSCYHKMSVVNPCLPSIMVINCLGAGASHVLTACSLLAQLPVPYVKKSYENLPSCPRRLRTWELRRR